MTLKEFATKDIDFKNLNRNAFLPRGKMLNIEIGDRLTKGCVSVFRSGKYQIRSSFLFQTPENAVADGQIADPDSLAAALREQMNLHGLKDLNNAAFALTSSKVATREVKLPPVRDNRLRDVIRTNAADYFPVDLSKYYVAHCLLERVETGEDEHCRVLAFAAPLQLLQSYFQLAEKARLRVRSIDYSGNSQYQVLRSVGGEAVTMYVNLDSSSSCITFLKGGDFLLQRTFTFGGDEVVLDYMDVSGEKDYLAALRECSGKEKPELSESLSRLEENIIRSANYFNSSHWDQPVEKIVLLGPCARLAGLRELIAKGTGLDAAYLDGTPSAGLSVSAVHAEGDVSAYLSCVGSNIAPLDLVPPQFRAEKKLLRSSKDKSKETNIRDGAIICAVCLAAAVALSVSGVLRYSVAGAEKTAAQKEIANLSYTEKDYKTYVQYKAEADSLVKLSGEINSPNDSLTEFLGELEAKMPSQILLLSAACDRGGVTMNITVPDYSEVAVVLVQLRSFQSIQDIQIASVDKATDQSGGSYVKFSLTCTYGVNPYQNGIDPYASKAKGTGSSEAPASSAAPASSTAEN